MAPVVPTTVSGSIKDVGSYPTGNPSITAKSVLGEVETKKQDLNVVILIMDDVGIEKFQAYLPITNTPNSVCRIPNIKNTVINKGINFNNFWAAPICGPLRSGVQSGLYGHHTGFFTNIVENPADISGKFYLGCDPANRDNHSIQWIRCLAKAIREGRPNSTYKLGMFGKSHLQESAGHDEWCTSGGDWDIFKGDFGNPPTHYSSWNKISSTRGGATTNTPKTNTDITGDQLADIQAWLTTVGTRPFVLLWPGHEGHESTSIGYETPNPARVSTTSKNEWIAAFGGSYPTIGTPVGPTGTQDPTEQAKRKMIQKHQIEAYDSCFGDLVATLVANGQFDNTVFIVLADNGTETSVVEAPFDPVHYKRSVYAGALRCPLWISGPVVGDYPRSSDEIVNCVDLYQTILDICDVYPAGANSDFANGVTPTQHTRDSQSFLPHIKDPSVPVTRAYNFGILGGPYCGFGYDPARKLYVPSINSTIWAIADKDYYLIRFGGTTQTQKMWAADDYLQEDKDNVLATDPNNPAVILGKQKLEALLNLVINT